MVNVTASYFLKHFFKEALSNYYVFSLLPAGFLLLLKGTGIYLQVNYRTSCPEVLICKGV